MKTNFNHTSLNAALLLLIVPATLQAQFTFTTNYNGTLNLVLYSGTNPVVSIPGSSDGLMVTSIGSGAFDGNAIVTSVMIPKESSGSCPMHLMAVLT